MRSPAIQQADLVILSAGSLLTSLMPNLLLTELLEAIANSEAPVIFIANMQPIDDAVGALTLDQQCQWMEQILGQNIIDAVIWPRSREHHDCDWIYTLTTDVGDNNSPLRHDKIKLISAINSILEKFKSTALSNTNTAA